MKFTCEHCGNKKKKVIKARTLDGSVKSIVKCTKCGRQEVKHE